MKERREGLVVRKLADDEPGRAPSVAREQRFQQESDPIAGGDMNPDDICRPRDGAIQEQATEVGEREANGLIIRSRERQLELLAHARVMARPAELPVDERAYAAVVALRKGKSPHLLVSAVG